MASIKAPGGAYHYRRHKRWGARQEAAWRQSVKDHGGYTYYERRRKAYVVVVDGSDEAPRGYGTIYVGERWNGRGEAVDEFLAEILALEANAPVREQKWGWRCGPENAMPLAFNIELIEERVIHRDTLQYHTVTKVGLIPEGDETWGFANDRFVREVLRVAPSYQQTNVCMTEKSREECWQSLIMACQYASNAVIKQIRDWENKRAVKLRCLNVAHPSMLANIYGVDHGVLNDPLLPSRFRIEWLLTTLPLAVLEVSIFIILGESSSFRFVLSENDNGFNLDYVAKTIGAFLDNLPTAAPIVAGGRIIASD